MHIRRSPSGDGPTIYRPAESVASVRLDPPARPVAHEPDSIPPPPRDSLLMRVNRRRGQILTVMVSIAAIASFGSVVWWAPPPLYGKVGPTIAILTDSLGDLARLR